MKSIEKKEVQEKGKLVYSLIEEVVTKVGPRLPTTPDEEKGCDLIGEQMQRELNAVPIKESFTCAPKASIAGIPLLGIGGAIMFALFYLSPIAALVMGAIISLFGILQICLYTGAMDFLFKHGKSNNIYSVLEPKEKANYTILLSAHIDTSWCWKLSYKNAKTAIPKTITGVISLLVLIGVTIAAVAKGAYSYKYLESLFTTTGPLNGEQISAIVMYCIPFLCLPGCYWLTNYLIWDPKYASPGAMDNMSGVAIGIAAAKYLQEHPDKWPNDCRIVVSAMGCEEAGLKGSSAFCKKHKHETEWFDPNTLYNINLDSFRDDDHFNAVKGDMWLGTRFDKDLVNMSLEAMQEAGVTPHTILNPVGGCDSTPFCKSKIKTVTINAQNPTVTNYYHTPNDNLEGLSMFSLEKGFETVINLIPKVDKYHKEKQN